MGLLFFRQKPHEVTISGELRQLERRARDALLAAGSSYSRAALAAESQVPEDALAAWIDGGLPPQDDVRLVGMVRVLSAWAQTGPLAEAEWRLLLVAARDRAAAQVGLAESPLAKETRLGRGLKWAAVAVIASLCAALGNDINSAIEGLGSSGAQPSASTSPSVAASTRVVGGASVSAGPDGLQAQAEWCCKFTSIQADTGFYWDGSAAALSADLDTQGSAVTTASLTPAGLGSSRSLSRPAAPRRSGSRHRRSSCAAAPRMSSRA